jgi:SH3 domain protein
MLRGIALVICLVPGLVFAETVWVNDILYLGVRPQRDSGKPIAVVKSGTVLEVLEREKRYLKIRTPDGVEGWVSTTYISETMPARQQLAELEERNSELNNELERAQSETDKINEANTTLSANLLAMTEERDQLQQKVAELEAEIEALRPKPETQEPDYTLHYLVGGVTLMILIAFGLGARWYRGKVIKRLGGLRI